VKTFRNVLSMVLLLLCAASASAVTLEWKFTPGDEQNYRLTQSARLSAGPADALKQFTSVKQEIDLTWRVVEVSDEGNATISLAVTAFSFLATGPDGQEVRYDSESTEEPQGYAAMLLPIGKRLAEAEVQLTMTPRGEVSDVKLPEELAEAVKSIPSGKKFAQDGGVTSFESMASLGAPLLLPTGDVTVGKSWTEKRELELPVFGTVTVAYAFEVKDPPKDNKVTIDQQMTIEAESPEGMNGLKLINQKSTGKIEFDFEAGRPELSTLTYETELEQPTHDEGHMKLEHTIEFRRLVDDSQ
jgi:Family of unknown function (DUF6263)